ncbi:MAG: hypothetical protein HYZ49_17645 [Chloroflexi bacterium]|nr:hypothetical protein [Chloroflexota bacterium]
MRARKIALIWILLIFMLAACGSEGTPTAGVLGEGYYPVSETFTHFYESRDGPHTLGAAISPEFAEDGVLVQYFENGRLEYHPQLPAESQIILANLGEITYGPSPCVPPESVVSGALYFSATCHSVRPEFRPFFEKYGGVSFFGYPISEAYVEDGHLMQVFERMAIVWDGARAEDQQFGLARLGSRACANNNCLIPPSSENIRTSTPTAPPTLDTIEAFYLTHGGERVFGLPLGGRQTGSDSAVEQVFENAVLYENPAASEGVSFRPLGLQTLGGPAPSAPQLDDPNSGYFDKYGHNVAYGVYDFYRKYGGEAVFGFPLDELHVAGDHLEQHFENIAITWHLNLPTDQAVQLMNLGQRTLPPQPSFTLPPSVQPQMLFVVTEPEFSVLEAEKKQQTLRAWVADENGLPVVGARVTFVMNTPSGELKYVINATDANGFASVTFKLKSYKPGDFMFYSATAAYGGLTASKDDAFVPWDEKLKP